MGSGPSKPIDEPEVDLPELPTLPTSTRPTRTPIIVPSASASFSESSSETVSPAETSTTLPEEPEATTTDADPTESTPEPTTTTDSPDEQSISDPVLPTLSDTTSATDGLSPTGTGISAGQDGTSKSGGGPNVAAIVVPVIIASALIGALLAIFIMRRRRRSQSRRLLEDFQRRNSMSVPVDGEDKFYGTPAKPYAPAPHATYTPPTIQTFGVDGYNRSSGYEVVIPAYASPSWSAGSPAGPYAQPAYAAAALHLGWAPPHPESDAQSFSSHTTTGLAGFGARPLSPAPPLPPPSVGPAPAPAPTPTPVPAPATVAPITLAPAAMVTRSVSVRSTGTVASDAMEDRRQLRITNARSDASVHPPTISPTSPRAPKTGKDDDELGEETLKAWMQD